MDCVRGPIPRKDQITNLPLDTGKTRGNKPAWTPLESTGQTETSSYSQSEESAVVEVGPDGDCFIEAEPLSEN